MKAAKKTMLMDGAKVAYTHGQYGKKVAEITFKDGGSITVAASFAMLLDVKVRVAIKEHYSNVIAGLTKTAREINSNARKVA